MDDMDYLPNPNDFEGIEEILYELEEDYIAGMDLDDERLDYYEGRYDKVCRDQCPKCER